MNRDRGAFWSPAPKAGWIDPVGAVAHQADTGGSFLLEARTSCRPPRRCAAESARRRLADVRSCRSPGPVWPSAVRRSVEESSNPCSEPSASSAIRSIAAAGWIRTPPTPNVESSAPSPSSRTSQAPRASKDTLPSGRMLVREYTPLTTARPLDNGTIDATSCASASVRLTRVRIENARRPPVPKERSSSPVVVVRPIVNVQSSSMRDV